VQESRFDNLARLLTQPRSRRTLLQSLLGTAAALLGNGLGSSAHSRAQEQPPATPVEGEPTETPLTEPSATPTATSEPSSTPTALPTIAETSTAPTPSATATPEVRSQSLVCPTGEIDCGYPVCIDPLTHPLHCGGCTPICESQYCCNGTCCTEVQECIAGQCDPATTGALRLSVLDETGSPLVEDIWFEVFHDFGGGPRGSWIPWGRENAVQGRGIYRQRPWGTLYVWPLEPGSYVLAHTYGSPERALLPDRGFTITAAQYTDLTIQVPKGGASVALRLTLSPPFPSEFWSPNPAVFTSLPDGKIGDRVTAIGMLSDGGDWIPVDGFVQLPGLRPGDYLITEGISDITALDPGVIIKPYTFFSVVDESRQVISLTCGADIVDAYGGYREWCVPSADCPADAIDCGGACIGSNTDPFNCGGCGIACGAGQTCTEGRCTALEIRPRITAGPAVGQIAATAAFFSWATDQPSTTRIEFGTTTALGQFKEYTRKVTAHSMRVYEGLKPNTLYYWRVRSSNSVGTATSRLRSFRTLTCLTGRTACGDKCVFLSSDENNCGACGKRCAQGQVCVSGRCVFPSKWELFAPFTDDQSAHRGDPPAPDDKTAVCTGLNGLHDKQLDLASGRLGHHIFGWGGICGSWNPLSPGVSRTEASRVVLLLGEEFVAPVADDYRIRAEVSLAGTALAAAGQNAHSMLAGLLSDEIADLITRGLANPANLFPSVGTVEINALLKIDSSYTRKRIKNLAATSIDYWFPSDQETTLGGTVIAERTLRLEAGQRVRIYGGLETIIKMWGNASTSATLSGSRLSRILIVRV
jgi:hypothetical protein